MLQHKLASLTLWDHLESYSGQTILLHENRSKSRILLVFVPSSVSKGIKNNFEVLF